jgi:type IV pilus assembly protein PilW
MKTPSVHGRGFTLLELMIASALGIIVITTGLVVGTQMQKRALFEEQTMMAQVTGRTVKDLILHDVWRAGVGMGNTPIAFNNGDERSALMVWNKPDLTAGVLPAMPADVTFQQAPTAALASDALQIHWGETQGAITLTTCANTKFRSGNEFCAGPGVSTALIQPSGPTRAIMASGGARTACPVTITNVVPGAGGVKSTITIDSSKTLAAVCGDGAAGWGAPTGTSTDVVNWMAMRLGGTAYRVNWRGNIPTLEYQLVGQAGWSVLSRDVEQLTVREGVIDFANSDNRLTWFPEKTTPAPPVPRVSISECTLAKYDTGECSLGGKEADGSLVVRPATNDELRKRLRQRVRQLEITLVIRTRRTNQDAAMGGTDEEGNVRDGYSRRRFTFTVEPRNFMTVGMVRPAVSEAAAP